MKVSCPFATVHGRPADYQQNNSEGINQFHLELNRSQEKNFLDPQKNEEKITKAGWS